MNEENTECEPFHFPFSLLYFFRLTRVEELITASHRVQGINSHLSPSPNLQPPRLPTPPPIDFIDPLLLSYPLLLPYTSFQTLPLDSTCLH